MSLEIRIARLEQWRQVQTGLSVGDLREQLIARLDRIAERHHAAADDFGFYPPMEALSPAERFALGDLNFSPREWMETSDSFKKSVRMCSEWLGY